MSATSEYPLSVQDSFYSKSSCFPVVGCNAYARCLAQISRSRKLEAAFDGFVQPCLLDGLALLHFVTATISLNIGSRRIYESHTILSCTVGDCFAGRKCEH